MANYVLYNNKFYNSSGQEVIPSGFIGSIQYKTSRLTVEPSLVHKVSVEGDVFYCGHTFDDNIPEGDTHLNYFNIIEGTTYPAVAASDYHGMSDQWFVKRDGTWYQYVDPNHDYNPVLDGEGTAVTSSSKINELESIYNENGETWTDCTLSLKSQYMAANPVSLQVYNYGFSLYNNLFFQSPVAIGFKYSVFRGASYDNAESVYSASTYDVSLPTSDLPLLADQAYKYDDKFYDINYNEIFGATEISSVSTNRGIYSKNFQVAATKKVIDGYTFYDNGTYRLDATKAAWSAETETYTYLHSSDPNKDYVWVNNHWMVWNNGSPIEETNASYNQKLSLIDATGISDTIAKGVLTFEILQVVDNQNVFSYDDLGNPSNVAAHTSFSGEVYPLYISNITLAPPITIGHAKKYIKNNGNLQQTTEAIIKTYDTLALANADIANIANNQPVIVKTDPSYQGNFGLYIKDNNALTKVFQGGSPSTDDYEIGDIKQFYSLSDITDDWLKLDGSTFDTTKYPDLYTFLGNTNVLPNFKGRCVRCAAPSSTKFSNCKSRTFGDSQVMLHTHSATADSHSHNDVSNQHTHQYYTYVNSSQKLYKNATTWTNYYNGALGSTNSMNITSSSVDSVNYSGSTSSVGSAEGRINQASVYMCIKGK